MSQQPGLIPIFADAKNGKVYLQVPAKAPEYLYYSSLPQGLGSNDIGLDRGQLLSLDAKLVVFEDAGEKVLLRQRNTQYRAVSDNPLEQRSVEEAFASSVLWGFPVVARDADSLLLDATEFVLRDSHGVARTLAATNQGDFSLDASRSALYWPRTKAFPKNTELEATITFTGDKPGEFVQQVAPDPYSISVRMHHSFVQLPEAGFVARPFHPESGFWSFEYKDYAVPIEAEMMQRFVPRHRLQKKDPTAAISEAVEPIVYYLDPGVPEPVRSALLDGAKWWDQAFAAAGFKDAFQVKMLPADADPLDVRYNVIQWVHRATRGWSYGYGLMDPRTGEIIKGHVTLGSLRVRQDYLIAQGMTAPFSAEGSASATTTEDTTAQAALSEMALARIRQLSAHEIGHTLGIAHNFAASNKDRASVMDYPHPVLSMGADNKITLTGAYASGIGDWDKRVIQYGYGDFADDKTRLDFVGQAHQQGFRFISDPDSNGSKLPHAYSSLWDNGADAVTELERVMKLRQQALSNFSSKALANGRPYSDLAEILMPVYFAHRYQTEAAGKWLGGYDYRYQVKTAGEKLLYQAVAGADQTRALQALLSTINPTALALPTAVEQLIPPKAYGYSNNRESPQGYTGLVLDPLSLAEAAAQHSFSILLNGERLARLQWQHQTDNSVPSVALLLAKVWQQLQTPAAAKPLISRRLQVSYLLQISKLAQNEQLAPEIRAELLVLLNTIQQGAKAAKDAHSLLLQQLATQAQKDAANLSKLKALAPPPGSPI
ncbi:peptidase [Rheinheimera sp. SA_1]|nr:peptidase [Rheinheimera sp. SA_1]